MRGFTTKGVMLLPKFETFDSRSIDYQLTLKRSVDKAIAFFAQKGITFELFTTNEMANDLRPEGVEWINSSPEEDMFFIRKNVEGLSSMLEGRDLPELYEQARKKYPTQKGLSVEERFEITEKRDKYIANEYIKQSKFVMTFEHPQNSYYKVKAGEGDGRIIMKVSHQNFIVTCMMSGAPIDLAHIIQYNGSSMPLQRWEEEKA